MKPEELKTQLCGVCVISITPFHEDGTFDSKGYEKNLRFILDGGLNHSNSTIVIGGSTGECGSMTIAERKEVLEMAVSYLGKELPVIAGCNSTCISESIDLAHHAEKTGAAGIMALSPYYYPARDEESIYLFYEKLARNTNLGILLYNNLEVMHVDCSISVLKRLKEIPNFVGMKECTPSFYKMTREVQELGDKITMINGHGEFLEPYCGMAGLPGFISSMANFAPDLVRRIWNSRSAKDYDTAKILRDRLVPYMDLAIKHSTLGGEYRVISLIKYITDYVGSCGGYPRIPCPPLSEEDKKEIRTIIDGLDLS